MAGIRPGKGASLTQLSMYVSGCACMFTYAITTIYILCYYSYNMLLLLVYAITTVSDSLQPSGL